MDAMAEQLGQHTLRGERVADKLPEVIGGGMDWTWQTWQPMNDSVFIQRLEPMLKPQNGIITVANDSKAPILRKGVILSCGPGKWHPGEWQKIRQKPNAGCASEEWWKFDINPDRAKLKADGNWFEWEWIPGWRETMAVKPGDVVLFNARWNDLAHAELKPIGSDAKSKTAPLERPLSYRFDPKIHLVQEADIAGVLHE